MNYLEIKIYTNAEGLEIIPYTLSEVGIDTYEIQDQSIVEELLQKKNAYDWDYIDESVLDQKHLETKVKIYLNDDLEGRQKVEEIKEAVAQLKANDDQELFGRLAVEVVHADDSQWKDNWKEYFKPSRITSRITVKPSWEPYEKKHPDELIIEIDPGMAFGTGTHETTSLCVKLLEKYFKSEDELVLDAGCGSGILSMAASLLGAKTVIAVDIDPVAVDVARENIGKNGLSEGIQVLEGDLTKGIPYKADIIMANLMADLIIYLAGDIYRHLKGRGIFISSGILIEKKDEVRKALEESNFKVLEIVQDGEWCAICAEWNQ